jgi:hypothetical protein
MPRHDLDPVALVAGIVLTGTGLVALLERGTGLAVRWVAPVVLILVGIAGLLATRQRVGEPEDGDG